MTYLAMTGPEGSAAELKYGPRETWVIPQGPYDPSLRVNLNTGEHRPAGTW